MSAVSTMRTALLVSRSVVDGWLFRAGLPSSAAGPLLVASAAVAAGAGWVGARVVEATGSGLPPDPLFLGLALTLVQCLAALGSVFATSAFVQRSARLRWWETMPVSSTALAAGSAIPVWFIGALEVLLSTPGLIVAFESVVAPWLVVSLTTAAIAFGIVQGQALLWLVQRLLARRSSLDTMTLPFTVVLWVATTAGTVAFMSAVVQFRLPSWSLLAASPLGFPALAHTALVQDWAGVGAVLVAVGCAAAVATGVLRRPVRREWSSLPVVMIGPRWTNGSLLGLEVVRLLRRKRVLSVYLSVLIVQLALAAVILRADEATASSAIDNCVFLTALLMAYVPLLARGQNDRRPYAVALGAEPFAWGLRIAVSGWLLALAGAVPAALLLAAVAQRWQIGAAAMLLSAAFGAVAAVVGAVLMPSEETGGLETVSAGIVAATGLAAGRAVGALGIEGVVATSAALAFAAPPLLIAAGLLEVRRWPRATTSTTARAAAAAASHRSPSIR